MEREGQEKIDWENMNKLRLLIQIIKMDDFSDSLTYIIFLFISAMLALIFSFVIMSNIFSPNEGLPVSHSQLRIGNRVNLNLFFNYKA